MYVRAENFLPYKRNYHKSHIRKIERRSIIAIRISWGFNRIALNPEFKSIPSIFYLLILHTKQIIIPPYQFLGNSSVFILMIGIIKRCFP